MVQQYDAIENIVDENKIVSGLLMIYMYVPGIRHL